MMTRTQRILFAISGIAGMLASFFSPVLLPYPVFVMAVLRNWRLPKIGAPALQLLLSTSLCALLLETSAWLDNFIKNSPDPILFHPQLIPDLIMSIGIYSAWWLTWWLILRYYHFSIKTIFLITGFYGVFIEQQGAVFLSGLANFPLGVMWWLFVAVVYGSTMSLAVFLVRDRFTATRKSWIKYPLALAGLFFYLRHIDCLGSNS
jgi:hypothetical protein